MPIDLAYTPTYPEPGDIVTLSLTDSVGDPNYARFEIDTVPSESALETGLLIDANGTYLKTFTPDVAGVYEIIPYDVRAFLGQGQFAGDAGGEPRQIVIGPVARKSVYVVSYSDLRIATLPGHDITLRLGIANATIITAELVDPSTDLARLAALKTAISDAVTALEGVVVSTIASTLLARVTALRTAFEAHRVLTAGAVHASADTTNVVNYEPPNTDDAALVCLQDLYEKIKGHLLAGAAGGTWHTNDDTLHTIMTPKPLTKAQAHVTLSDLEERIYELHRVQLLTPTVHGLADNTNTLAAPTLLTTLIVLYLDFIADNVAVSLSGEHFGLSAAERAYGMSPAP